MGVISQIRDLDDTAKMRARGAQSRRSHTHCAPLASPAHPLNALAFKKQCGKSLYYTFAVCFFYAELLI
jgi:uncharacterized ParB-like nuclease family protein